MDEQPGLFDEIDADVAAQSNWRHRVAMLRYVLEARLADGEGLFRTVMTSDLIRLIQFIDASEASRA